MRLLIAAIIPDVEVALSFFGTKLFRKRDIVSEKRTREAPTSDSELLCRFPKLGVPNVTCVCYFGAPAITRLREVDGPP